MTTYTETSQDYLGGIARTLVFENGTKMSVVKHNFSYGGPQGLWEIAVINEEGDFITQDIWYDLDDDVMGYVTDLQLKKYISDVAEHDDDFDF